MDARTELQIKIKTILQEYKSSRGVNTAKAENEIMSLVNSNNTTEKDWIRVEKQKPICWESGDWDGKRSDVVLCIDANGEEHLALCYEGFMDGSHFFEWYDKDDFGLQVEVIYWIEIKKP